MEPVELEPSHGIQPKADDREKMDEPPPVRLAALNDVHLHTPAGLEEKLDGFYVRIWQFQRDTAEPGIVYRAENVRLRFEVMPTKPLEHDTLRPQGIEVSSLPEAERKLIDLEWEYIHQVGLTPGQNSLLLQDPAGNWIEITESRRLG